MRPFPRSLSVLAALTFTVAACGAAKTPPPATAPATLDPSTNVGSKEPPAKTAERPHAKTAAEATSMIDDIIETRRDAIIGCVQDARKRRGDARARVEFELGIDQEGVLIGVKTPKGVKDDQAFNDCVRDALRPVLFPKSSAGVITVRKAFSDQLVYPK